MKPHLKSVIKRYDNFALLCPNVEKMSEKKTIQGELHIIYDFGRYIIGFGCGIRYTSMKYIVLLCVVQ